MGNKSLEKIDQELLKEEKVLREKLDQFTKEVYNRKNEMVPFGHVFMRKTELKVMQRDDSAKFFKQLGNIIGQAAMAYTTGKVDPALISGVCNFIAMVAGSSDGMIRENTEYAVEKRHGAIIRTDVITVGKSLNSEGGFNSSSKSMFGFCFMISSIQMESLDENELTLANGLEERTDFQPVQAPEQ